VYLIFFRYLNKTVLSTQERPIPSINQLKKTSWCIDIPTRQNSTNDNTRHSISTNRFLLTNRSTSLRRYLPSSIALVNHLAKLERIDRSSFLDAKSVLMLKIPSLDSSTALLSIFHSRARIRTNVRASTHNCASHDALDPHVKRG